MRISRLFRCAIIGLISASASCRPAAPTPLEPAPYTLTSTPIQPRPTDAQAATASITPSPTARPVTPTATLFPEEYLHTVSDETGAITAVVPVIWSDTRTLPWLDPAGKTIGTTFMASTDVDAFTGWQVEGVSISVSRRLSRGYIQLLDEEYATYSQVCRDPFLDRWDFENEFHRGKYYALVDCGGVEDGWLSLLAVVGRADPTAYTARVLAYDMIPIFGEDFRDIIMQFQVDSEKLP